MTSDSIIHDHFHALLVSQQQGVHTISRETAASANVCFSTAQRHFYVKKAAGELLLSSIKVAMLFGRFGHSCPDRIFSSVTERVLYI